MASIRWGGLRPEPYDPDAVDADGDGIVQEGTAFERPMGTRVLDEAGKDIARGFSTTERPAGYKIVDGNGRKIDYTPTYLRSTPTTAPQAPQGPVHLGAPSLQQRGLPNLGAIVHGETQPASAITPIPQEIPTPSASAATPEVPTQSRQVPPTFDDFVSTEKERLSDSTAEWRDLTYQSIDGTTQTIRREHYIETQNLELAVRQELGRRIAEEVPLEDLVAWAEQHIPFRVQPGRESAPVSNWATGESWEVNGADVLFDAYGRIRYYGPNDEMNLRSPSRVISREDPMYHQLLAEKVAAFFVDKWNETSNDNDVYALAIQDVARQLYGLEGTTGWNASVDVDTYVGKHRNVLEAVVRAQHSHTQERLKASGLTSIRIYRGIKISANDYQREGTLTQKILQTALEEGSDQGLIKDSEVALRPLSSWTTSLEMADNFMAPGGEIGNAARLYVDIPIDQVFSMPLTGSGVKGEDEIIILGSGNQPIPQTYWYVRDPGIVRATMVKDALRSAAPPVLAESGFRFEVRPHPEDPKQLAVALLEPLTGKAFFISSQSGDPIDSGIIQIPANNLEQWTADDWDRLIDSVDLNTQENLPLGLQALSELAPPGWQIVASGRTAAEVKVQGTVVASLSLADVLDPSDRSRPLPEAVAHLVARVQDRSFKEVITREVDAQLSQIRESSTSALDPMSGGGVLVRTWSTTSAGEETPVVRLVISNALNAASQQLEGSASLEQWRDGDWVQVVSTQGSQDYVDAQALSSFRTELIAALQAAQLVQTEEA